MGSLYAHIVSQLSHKKVFQYPRKMNSTTKFFDYNILKIFISRKKLPINSFPFILICIPLNSKKACNCKNKNRKP